MSTVTLAVFLMVLYPTQAPATKLLAEPAAATVIKLQMHPAPLAKSADKAEMIARLRNMQTHAAPAPSPLKGKLNADGRIEVFHGRGSAKSADLPEKPRD